MTTERTRFRDSRSWPFDLGLCVLGLALLVWSLPIAWDGGWQVGLAALIGVPLVVVIARFPMVLDNEDGCDRDRLRLDRPDLPALHVRRPARARRVGARRRGHPADLREEGVGLRLQHRRRHPRRRGGGGRAAPGAGVRHGYAAGAGGRGRGGGGVLLPRLRVDGGLGRHRLPDTRAPPPRPARHLARGRLLRPLRPARLPRCGRAAQQPVVDARASRRTAGDAARQHARDRARPGERPPAQRPLRGRGPCPGPARARTRDRGPAGRRATADPAARRGRAQLAARGARDRCAGTPGQGRALGRRHVAGPRPVDDRRRPARAGRARRDLLGGLRPPPADRRDGPLRAARPPDRPAQPRHPARPGRAGPAPRPPARRAGGPALRRPRRLQAGQRPVRPRCG